MVFGPQRRQTDTRTHRTLSHWHALPVKIGIGIAPFLPNLQRGRNQSQISGERTRYCGKNGYKHLLYKHLLSDTFLKQSNYFFFFLTRGNSTACNITWLHGFHPFSRFSAGLRFGRHPLSHISLSQPIHLVKPTTFTLQKKISFSTCHKILRGFSIFSSLRVLTIPS